MGEWRWIRIPINNRGSIWRSKVVFKEYHTLLKAVSSAIKELSSKSLISSYHFVAHDTLDLRLLILDEKKISEIKEILGGHLGKDKTNADFEPYNEKEDLLQALELTSDFIIQKIKIKTERPEELHAHIIHHLNLSSGMTAADEIDFDLNDAIYRLTKIIQEQNKGLSEEEAKEKAKEKIIKSLQN